MAFPPLSRVIHPSFTGYTDRELPCVYVASFDGGIQVPASHLIGGTAQSQWHYDQAVQAIERIRDGYALAIPGIADNLACGLWLDNGVYYFDVSTSFHDVADALDFGRDNNQISVYDSESGGTVAVLYRSE